MDIPDRGALLEALLQVEERAFFALDRACYILMSNAAGESLISYLGGAGHVRSLLELSVPNAVQRLQRLVLMVFEGHTVKNRESRMDYPDLGVVWWEIDYAPLRDAAGEVIAAGVWVRDISCLRAEQERIANSAAPSAMALGAALLRAHAGRPQIVESDEGLSQLTGYPREQLIGRDYDFLQAEDHEQPGMAALREALRGESSCDVVLRSQRADATVFLNHVSLLPIRASESAFNHFVAIHRDITRDLEIEARISFMERLLINAPGILIVFDASLHIVSCFGRSISLLGWSPEELRGQHFSKLFDTSKLDYVDSYAELLREGQRYEGPGALRTRAGGSIELSMFAQFVPGARGAPDRFVLHCQDRRAQQDLEEQLLRMKQYEHVGWMAQGLVHDLNHALTLALLHLDEFSDLLDDTDQNPSLESARLSLREASNLSRGVMQIARADRAEQPGVMELDQWLSQVSRTFQLIIPPGTELSLIASSGLVVRVVVSRLQQLLFNLIHNAAQAIAQQRPEQPYIRLVCEASEAQGMASIRVEDNGCGMREEQLREAFSPFYTTRADGSGLGLYMCKLIVERWGGQIRLVSQPGLGTRVSFTLPLAL